MASVLSGGLPKDFSAPRVCSYRVIFTEWRMKRLWGGGMPLSHATDTGWNSTQSASKSSRGHTEQLPGSITSRCVAFPHPLQNSIRSQGLSVSLGITTVSQGPMPLGGDIPLPHSPFSSLQCPLRDKEVCLAHKQVMVLHSWPDSANQVPIRTEE